MNNLPKITQFIKVKLGLEPSSDLKAQALNCYLPSPQWTRERGARKVTRKTQNTSLKDKVAFAWGWQSTVVMDPAEDSWKKPMPGHSSHEAEAGAAPPRVWLWSSVSACGHTLSHTAPRRVWPDHRTLSCVRFTATRDPSPNPHKGD